MIGCRFSIYPMTERFVDVILGAIKEMDTRGLEVKTDDISTCLLGDESQMFGAMLHAFREASKAAQHVVLTMLLSRGCPGEPDQPAACEPLPPGWSGPAAPLGAEPTGIRVAAQFSLYPLGVPNYMEVIYREIDATKQQGTFKRGEHFCTRLEGDMADVFAAIKEAFDNAERDSGHVVVHATISKGSPTPA